PILIPQQELSDLVFLAPYYGDIPKLTSRPLLRKITPKGCEINGKIVGVKGTVLVVKEGETYFACNLKSLIGTYIIIEEELSAKRGQRSLFEFV
ncbi:MAG: hypothetical protein U9O98_02790, partial [Asgard group archaeon]|nr:hypothetical protein [Asgard group archaeon]